MYIHTHIYTHTPRQISAARNYTTLCSMFQHILHCVVYFVAGSATPGGWGGTCLRPATDTIHLGSRPIDAPKFVNPCT